MVGCTELEKFSCSLKSRKPSKGNISAGVRSFFKAIKRLLTAYVWTLFWHVVLMPKTNLEMSRFWYVGELSIDAVIRWRRLQMSQRHCLIVRFRWLWIRIWRSCSEFTKCAWFFRQWEIFCVFQWSSSCQLKCATEVQKFGCLIYRFNVSSVLW